MGEEKGRLFPRETKRGVEKLPALVTNWALLDSFSISSCRCACKTHSKATGRGCREPDSKNQEGPVLLAPD